MSDDKPTEWNKEYEYDSLIAPLMAEILSVCKMHDIPMFATFQFCSSNGDEARGAGWCTSKIVPDVPGVEQRRIHDLDRVARHGWGVHPQSFTITTITKVPA